MHFLTKITLVCNRWSSSLQRNVLMEISAGLCKTVSQLRITLEDKQGSSRWGNGQPSLSESQLSETGATEGTGYRLGLCESCFFWRRKMSLWNSGEISKKIKVWKQTKKIWNFTLCLIPKYACVHAQSLQSLPALCDPMDGSPPGSSVYGILQARALEWVAMHSSREFSPPRGWTHISCVSLIAGRFFIAEPLGKPHLYIYICM